MLSSRLGIREDARMTEVALALKHPDLAALDGLGLRIPGLREAKRLRAGSRLEAPTSVISTVASGALIEVGAFCNLSGGTINNVRFGRYCSVASGVVIGPPRAPDRLAVDLAHGLLP
jgi:hypothetical protein